MAPSKKCSFCCNGPGIKAPQIPLGHQKNHFGAILIEFGDTKKCYTFSGLELPLKPNWRSQLHAQRPKMHPIPLGPLEKSYFC